MRIGVKTTKPKVVALNTTRTTKFVKKVIDKKSIKCFNYNQKAISKANVLSRRCYPSCRGNSVWIVLNGSFAFDQSIFIEKFCYSEWLEISVQCKIVDMTDFSTKAKHPTSPKPCTIADLLTCIDNLVTFTRRFKYKVIKESLLSPQSVLAMQPKRD